MQDRAQGWNLGAGGFLPQPLQCPGLAGAAWGAGAGSGRRCIPSLHCELLQRRDECQALRGGKALNRLFLFFPSSLGFFFPLPFPIFLVCLRSREWVYIYRVCLTTVSRKPSEISQKCCSNLCFPLTTPFSVKLSFFSLFVNNCGRFYFLSYRTSWNAESDLAPYPPTSCFFPQWK